MKAGWEARERTRKEKEREREEREAALAEAQGVETTPSEKTKGKGKGKGKSREQAFEAAFEQFGNFQPQTSSAKIEEVSEIENAMENTTLEDPKLEEELNGEDFQK